MNKAIWISIVCTLFAAPLVAQEEAVDEETFRVRIVEFRMKDGDDKEEIDLKELEKQYSKLVSSGAFEFLETVDLEAVAGRPTTVMFGKMLNVVDGIRGNTKMMRQMQIGTAVQVKVEPKNEKVSVTLSYQASRMKENEAEDELPEFENVQLKTSALVTLGEEKYLATFAKGSRTFMILQVRR